MLLVSARPGFSQSESITFVLELGCIYVGEDLHVLRCQRPLEPLIEV